MKIDSRGEAWRSWVLENLSRYCFPKTMLADMLNAGWPLSDAITAIDEGLGLLGRSSDWHIALPQPSLNRGSFLLDRPRIQLLPEILSRQECTSLIELAMAKGMVPATVIDQDDRGSVLHKGRSNSTVYFQKQECQLIAQIEARLSELTNWPADRAEGLQIQHYLQGQQYEPHYDWFDPQAAGSTRHLARGGQRLATTVIVLQQAIVGGATHFPKLGISLRPAIGEALFFQNVDVTGTPDASTLHGGEPVEHGIKIIATFWQRARPCPDPG